MPFAAKNFEHLLGTAGFSEQLLRNHFKLYEGYVNNTNGLVSKLEGLTREKRNDTPEFAEMQRRLGWEFNGMRLHELYFGNISKTPASLASKDFQARVAGIYGSWDAFLADLKAVGKMRGIGWVVLAHDPVSKSLYNVWINEHDVGLLAGAKILLVLDVFEHAYMLDYGLNRAGYIDSFMKAIDWKAVEGRF